LHALPHNKHLLLLLLQYSLPTKGYINSHTNIHRHETQKYVAATPHQTQVVNLVL